MSKLISLFRLFRIPMIALGLALFGGGLLYLVTPKLWRSYDSQSWTQVTGKILESRWQNKLVSQNAARPNFKLIPKIEYSYVVNNTEYKGTTITRSSFDELDKTLAKSKLEQYSTGRQVLVYYNPSNPSLSCLEQEKPSLTSVLGVIMGVVSFYVAFALIKQVGKA
ncbi:MAG TPA: DUF3592 domain-containing protein [Blastocatellia bacterium]|nr:DUF3592 domain-containing protein [Blastocatellia bacterium]